MTIIRSTTEKHFANMTWDEVYENSPFFHGQRLPTLFSPDGSTIYISSTDFNYSTTDPAKLSQALEDIKSIFDSAKQSDKYYKTAMAESDIIAVQGLLSKL